jgi:hypothetical protein
MISDRRKRRAYSPLVAAEYFLEAEVARTGAAAGIFLIDRGEVIASGVRSGEAREALAGLLDDPTTSRDVYAHPLTIPGRAFVLSSVDGRVRSVREVERTIERIFTTE